MIREFSFQHIDKIPVQCLWSDLNCDDFEYYNHTKCYECGGEFVTCGYSSVISGEHTSICKYNDSDEWVEEEGPMMSYFYEIDDDGKSAADIAKRLDGLPLCVVKFNNGPFADKKAFALTGGGMDLSKEIILAYARNGWAPPAFLRIPDYAGAWLNLDMKLAIEAVKETHRVMLGRAKYELEYIEHYEHRLKTEAKEQEAKNGKSKSAKGKPKAAKRKPKR
jgi:hypothetical protein